MVSFYSWLVLKVWNNSQQSFKKVFELKILSVFIKCVYSFIECFHRSATPLLATSRCQKWNTPWCAAMIHWKILQLELHSKEHLESIIFLQHSSQHCFWKVQGKPSLKMASLSTAEWLSLKIWEILVYAIDTHELRLFIKSYIEQTGCCVPQFKYNLPGPHWVLGFLKKSVILSNRHCQKFFLIHMIFTSWGYLFSWFWIVCSFLVFIEPKI